MRLVMSLWTQPKGWHHEGAEEMWSLSALRLRALVDAGQFSGLHLVTDYRGAEWASALRLPFTSLDTTLSALDPEQVNVWALGKLAAYAAQTEPFLHVDADVFIKRALPGWLLSAPVIVESVDPRCPCSRHFGNWKMPALWSDALKADCKLSWCFSIFGGNDVATITEAARTAMQVADDNKHYAAEEFTNGGAASVFVEQWGMTRHFPTWDVAPFLPSAATALYAADQYLHLGGGAKHAYEWRTKIRTSLAAAWPDQLSVCSSQRSLSPTTPA